MDNRLLQMQSYYKQTLKQNEVKTAGNRTTYCLTLDQVRNLYPERWHGQRPTDKDRVEMIQERILETGDVPGVIAMAFSLKDGLVIYDGLHRWTAARDISGNKIQLLIEILWNATEEDILAAWDDVNKAVSVSEMYIDREMIAAQIAPKIQLFIHELGKKYPDFVSRKTKCNRPNFRLDDPNLSNVISSVWKEDFGGKVAIEKVLEAIHGLNKEYDEQLASMPRLAVAGKPTIFKKCESHHFWLFAADGTLSRAALVDFISRRSI